MNYKTYKYLIKPTSLQKESIKKTLECCTYVYNKYILENEKGIYDTRKAKDIISEYKKENEFLNLADNSALMNVLFYLQSNCKKAYKQKKHTLTSYATSNLSGRQAVYFVGTEYVNLPKLGLVKAVIHRRLPEDVRIIKAIISIDNIKNYYLCISFSYERKTNNHTIDINKSIGLDYSQQHMFVDNNGNEANVEHYLQKYEHRINKLKYGLTKCRRNSRKYYELKYKIGKVYKRIVNQRKDSIHKLTTKLANKYDIVCVEDLNLNEIAGTYKLAKNTYDNGYGMFLEQLKYKLEDRGKVFIKIDKYYPSSKKCHKCGYINNNLTLSNREWICPKCNTKHNRDINAAINIRNRGLEEFTSIGYLDYAYKK